MADLWTHEGPKPRVGFPARAELDEVPGGLLRLVLDDEDNMVATTLDREAVRGLVEVLADWLDETHARL